MPSHKHKKKKKNSRKHKRLISDDEEEPWSKVKLSSSDSEGSATEEKLTSLVRKSYLSYLQQALTQNFENWIKGSEEIPKDSIQELVNKWSSIMEQKALRASMISELYRRNMIYSIKEIKESTNEGRLFIDDRSVSSLKLKLPLNKSTQTDKLFSEVETQTQAPVSSLLELPLPLSPSSRPYDPAIDFSSTVSSTLPQPSDICNITSTSDFCNPGQILFDIVKSTNKSAILNSIKETSLNRDIYKESTEQSKDSKSSLEKHIFPKSKGKSINTQTFEKNMPSNCEETPEESHVKKPQFCNNLDLRLNAMGLLSAIDIETEKAIAELAMEKSKKSNWYAEEIAQSCNLARNLLRLSTRRRERVKIKIKELFDHEDDSLTELSEKNITVCRKRIAHVVVSELTPIYQAKKIASRHLFKFLAKRITKTLMLHSYAPDKKSIRWKVKEFFSNGQVIMSESDCM